MKLPIVLRKTYEEMKEKFETAQHNNVIINRRNMELSKKNVELQHEIKELQAKSTLLTRKTKCKRCGEEIEIPKSSRKIYCDKCKKTK